MNYRAIQFLLRFLPVVLAGQGRLVGQDEPAAPVVTVTRDFLVQNWQTDDGLPRNNILSLEQDLRGYLWMGTPQGLIRFDGVRFLALEGDVSPALARGGVQDLFTDNSGALWVATRRTGLFRYADGILTNTTSASLPANVAVDSIVQDARGEIWVTRGDGLAGRIESGKFIPTAPLNTLAKGPMLFKLTTDSEGGLWFAKQETYGRLVGGQPTNVTTHPGGVILLAPSHSGGIWVSTGFDVRRLAAGPGAREEIIIPLSFGPYGVNTMREDRAGQLWLGMGKDGLFRLKDERLERIPGINHPVCDILEDPEGNLWVGTEGGGLFKIRPRVFHLASRAEGLPVESVVSVSGDWVAPFIGGVGKLLPNGKVTMTPGFDKVSVSAVCDDGAGGVWLGTSGGKVIHQVGGEPRSSVKMWSGNGPQIRVLHRDAGGNIWVGGFPSGLFFFPADETKRWTDLSWRGFTNKAVTALVSDPAGVVWIGTSTGELFRYAGDELRKFGTGEGFAGFPIAALLPETNDCLWVGTLGGGLGKFQRGKVQFLGERAGLDDSVVSQLFLDTTGWMWVGSSRGISRVLAGELQAVIEGRRESASAVRFGPSDGLQNVQCATEHQPSVCATADGRLRFATSRGVVTFAPSALPRNYQSPPLSMESVLVDDAPVPLNGELKLPSDYRKIEFRYTATSFTAPEKVRFRRRMTGFDGEWIQDGGARSALYPRLPPGRYEFQFTACNNDGVWNDEPFSFSFEVTPAVWQTAWFRAAAALAFAAGVGVVVLAATRLRMKRKLARLRQSHALERERARISRDLHDDLGARLTQMALLTDLAADDPSAPPDLKSQIKDVSAQARNAVQSLDETVWMTNPEKDTLGHVIGYVAQYAEQFFQPTPVHCRQDICRNVPVRMMPGRLRRDILLLVKESLNNVMKHSRATEVWLRIAVRGPLLRITVRDNGCGFDVAAPHVRTGLESMRQRAEAAGIRASVRSRPGAGTRVALVVPLMPQKPVNADP